MIHHVTRATRLLIFWSLIAGAIGLTSVRLLLAGLEDYKTELEQKIYDISGIQLRIHTLRAGTRGFNPEVILQGIDIQSVDAAGRPAVKLKEMRWGLDLVNLLFSGDLLSSCRFTLVGVQAALLRQADGRITIKGLASSSKEQPAWLFQGAKYEILQSEISWEDLQHDGRRLLFTHLDALLKNHDDHHEIHLWSRLPERYGESVRVSADVVGNLLTGEGVDGRVYVQADDVRINGPEALELPDGIALQRFGGSFQLWSDWRDSRPYRIGAHVQNAELGLRRPKAKTLNLEKLSGYLGWSAQAEQWRFSARDLVMSGGGRQWPLAEFYLAGRQHGAVSAWMTWLDLQEVSYLASFFLAPEVRAKLPENLNVTGVLQDFAVYLGLEDGGFAVNGAFSELTAESSDSAPQLKGLSGQILGTDQQGQLLLDSQSGSLAFPGLFREAIAFGRVAGKVDWRSDDRGWVLDSDYVVLDNADLVTYSQFKITVPEVEPASMELQTAFKGVSDVTRVPPYLPVGIMGEDVVEWLDHAFIGGQIRNGAFQLSGLLDEFPFTGGQGKFEVLFDVENGILSYQPDWPLLTHLDANVHFFGNSLQVNVHHAESENVRVEQAVVEIPELDGGDFLLVDGVLRGGIDDGLKFMQKTPLHARVDGLVAATEIQGDTSVDLKLKIPLVMGVPERVHGVIHVDDSELMVESIGLALQKLNGDLVFTEQGLFCKRLEALALGYPVQAVIDTDQQVIRISASGSSDMAQVYSQFPYFHNDFGAGHFAYNMQLDLPVADGVLAMLDIASDLQGVAVDLPAPLAKTAEQRRDFRISLELGQGRWLPLAANYNDALKLTFQIDKDTEKVHAGHIVFGEGFAVKPQQAGLSLDIEQNALNLSDWQGLFSASGQALDGLPALDHVVVDVERVQWGEESLGALQMDLQRSEQIWQGTIDSPLAQGRLSLPAKWSDDQTVRLRMSRLDLSKLGALRFPDRKQKKTAMPLLDIESEQVLWRGVALGVLRLQTENRPNGVHFKTIRLGGRDDQVELTADWLLRGDDSQTQIHGSLHSNDFGRLLERLGYNDDIKETEAKIDVSGRWGGAPQSFSLADFVGQLNIRLGEGRISSIEPGFGRLLGLIAMEQWSKRFTLDFSDVYETGLAFNRVDGRFDIQGGKAMTDNLLIDAVSARVKIKGSADLLEKTLDHTVLVLPKSSDALPIAGTIVGGIASVITQVLTDDYKEGYFFGSGYHISGTWGNAEITPLHDRDGLLKKTWTGLTDFSWLNPDENEVVPER